MRINRILAALAGMSALAAQAATTTAPLSVSATVVAGCTVSATPLAFGNFDPALSQDIQSTLTVNCSSGNAYNVALDAGTHLTSGIRAIQNTADPTKLVRYSLFKDAARSQQWGDSDFGNTYAAGSSLAGSGSGANQTLTVYASRSATPSATNGSYTDTVTVTVHF